MKIYVCAALACALVVSPALAQEAVPLKTLPFSPARQAGDFLFISGQIARTADGADVKESVAAETHQTMENIGRILKEHGYAFDDLVSVTVWLADIEDYHEMNKAYASYFEEQFPARACTGGAQIVFDFRVEIAAIAYKEDGDEEHHHHGADEDDGHHDGDDESEDHHHHGADEGEEHHDGDEEHHHHKADEDDGHHDGDDESEEHHHHKADEDDGHHDDATGDDHEHDDAADEEHHHHDDEN